MEIYGTGGMILQNMKDLLQCLPGLQRLELVDLQLVGGDGELLLFLKAFLLFQPSMLLTK